MTEPPLPRLHLVTDDAVLARPSFAATAGTLLAVGGSQVALHLRGPHTPGRPLWQAVRTLAPAAESAGGLLVVNDRVDVALAAGVGAVQLGQRSLPTGQARALLGEGARIGVSTHRGAEVRRAVAEGADWLFVGTLHSTPSHPGRAGRGVGAVTDAVAHAGSRPVLGIGGVGPHDVEAIRAAGGWGVAVLGGVWHAADAVSALRRYLAALDATAPTRDEAREAS